MVATTFTPDAEPAVLSRLRAVCDARGLTGLSAELGSIAAFVGSDLASVERALELTPLHKDRVGDAAGHLLAASGKRLRPLCVALASRVNGTFDDAARELAVAVELVHNATLLHDDVVDLGGTRRGRDAARVVYGNAASIFAGDWLLIEALRRVRAAALPDVLDELLAVIDEMIVAESLQLENRHRHSLSRDTYFRVIEGKTASLFRWALFAGARAGGARTEVAQALATYGRELGLAFQIIDDALDLAGDSSETGKALFSDVREGKLTYPLIHGQEHDPTITPLLVEITKTPEGQAVDVDLEAGVLDRLRRAGSIEASIETARAHAHAARESLRFVPECPARAALEVVSEAAVHRTS